MRTLSLLHISSTEKILFPIIGFLLTTFIVPDAIPLLGMLFLGNLLKESGVVRRLANTASNQLIDIMTILIGLTVGASTQADVFLTPKTIGIFVLGALSFIVATMGGVLFVKLDVYKRQRNSPWYWWPATAASPGTGEFRAENRQRAPCG